MSDIYFFLKSGDMTMWVGGTADKIDICLISEIVQYPQKKAMRFFALGGDELDEYLDRCLEIFDAYARSCGCDMIESQGRRAWERLLGLRDFEYSGVMMEKDLT